MFTLTNLIFMKKKFVYSILFMFLGTYASMAQACTLTAFCTGGNWSSASTWLASGACGGSTTPADNMVIIIPACATVSVNINSPTYNNMSIYVYGDLQFNGGQKINMSANGYVYVAPGGSLTGGNGGSKINIGGSTVWTGPGPTSGPESYGTSPLPLELSNFTANINGIKVDLLWKTQSEKNNLKFEIERSDDAVTFSKIGQVDLKTKNGNSSIPIDYVFTDANPSSSTNYYRLKQIDIDQTFQYSSIISATSFKEKNIKFIVYPNPNQGEFTADISGVENNHQVGIFLYDQKGRLHYKSNFYIQDSQNTKVQIVPESKLSNGIYICTLMVEEISFKVKVVVN
jgi:hypothetical protein